MSKLRKILYVFIILSQLGAVVEVKHPDTGQPVEATINKLIDQSSYTVGKLRLIL